MKRNSRYYHWQIAYKHKNEEEYTLISNPEYAWAADPFLVEYEGRILLFAELFLFKSERNGVIGVCEYIDGHFSDWQIAMDEHWHLSYPNVFVEDGKLFMCPESYQKHEVSIYELVEFPNKWKVCRTIFQNVLYVDTTFVNDEEDCYVFTFEPTFVKNAGKLLLGKIPATTEMTHSWMPNGELIKITDDISVARPAGNFIKQDGKLFRVCQNSEKGYGEGIVFTEVEKLWPEYKEHVVKKIYPSDIRVNSKRVYEGIHTYNCLGDLEVIDLKYYNPSLCEYFASRRTRKVFLGKY